MEIEHSPLMNEFISFWFETKVNGQLKYETLLDFLGDEWQVTDSTYDSPILLRGPLDPRHTELQMYEDAKAKVEQAIVNGIIGA